MYLYHENSQFFWKLMFSYYCPPYHNIVLWLIFFHILYKFYLSMKTRKLHQFWYFLFISCSNFTTKGSNSYPNFFKKFFCQIKRGGQHVFLFWLSPSPLSKKCHEQWNIQAQIRVLKVKEQPLLQCCRILVPVRPVDI